jgi:uncharacterized membrane protein YhaH (DUF805 family)
MSDNVVPPGNVTGAWYPDPSGRHQYRWWNGTSWTGAVADDGVTSNDPVPPVGPIVQQQAPPTLAAPSLGPFEAVRMVFHRYADFRGRASLPEYWWSVLFFSIAGIVTAMMLPNAVYVLLLLGIVTPGLAVTCRRLHDTGRSGWLQLLNFIPFVGPVVLIVFLALPSDRGPNRFGPAWY